MDPEPQETVTPTPESSAAPQATPPPAWADVKEDPSFQALSPEKKLVAFTRWHDDAYNHAKTFPDWDQHKDNFNTKAAETLDQLSNAAGGLSPDQARAKIAQDALTSGDQADKLFPDTSLLPDRNPREVARDRLQAMGPDIYRAYLSSHQLPALPSPTDQKDEPTVNDPGQITATPTILGELAAGVKQEFTQPPAGTPSVADLMPLVPTNPHFKAAMSMVWNDVRESLRPFFGATEAQKVAESIPWGKNPDGSVHYEYKPLGLNGEGLLSPALEAGLGNPETVAQKFGVDTSKWYFQHDSEDGLGTSLAKGAVNAVHQLGVSLISPAFLLGSLKNAATFTKLANAGFAADMLSNVGPQLAAADKAKDPLEFTQNLLGAAGSLAFGLKSGEHVLTKVGPDGMSWGEITRHVGDMSDPVLQIAGSTPELETRQPKVYSAIIDELNRRGLQPKPPSEVVPKTTTSPELTQASAEASKTLSDASAQADALRAANAPQTAEAVAAQANADAQATVAQAATAPDQPAPAGIRLSSQQEADGNYRHALDIPAGTTVEQLQAFAKNVPTEHLPPEAAKALQDQIAAEITRLKEPAAPPVASTTSAPPTTAGETPTPPAQLQIVSTAIRDSAAPDNVVRGADWNSGHDTFTKKALEAGIEPDTLERGFIVRAPDGSERFASREEAASIASANGQAAPGVARLRSQDLVDLAPAAVRGVAEPETRAVVAPEGDRLAPAPPSRPIAEPARAPSVAAAAKEHAVRLTDEEKAAKVASGRETGLQHTLETGVVPTQAELHRLTGNSTDASKLLKELRARVVEEYPPEATPEGSTVTETKHPLTGDKLPSFVDATGKVRPQFTNDPEITAQQIDTGVASTSPAARLYIPDELATTGKVNPAIRYAKDADGRYYVIGSEARLPNGKSIPITDADQLTKPYQEAQRLSGTAQKPLGLDPKTLQEVATAVEKGLADRKLDFGPLEFHLEDAVDPGEVAPAEGETQAAIPADAAPPTGTDLVKKLTDTAIANHEALAAMGLEKPSEVENPVGKAIKAISVNNQLPANLRILARELIKAGIDFSKVKLYYTARPEWDTAGLYTNSARVGRGRIDLNVAATHVGGIETSLLHEAVHHVTLLKLAENYDRTPTEEKAFQQIKRAYDKVLNEVFKAEHDGREGTPEELAKFAKAQGDKRVTGMPKNSIYYGLFNVREFVAETLSSARFQKFLSTFESAEPAVRGRIGNILNGIRNALKDLFAGREVKRGSTLDQALEASYKLLQEPTEQGRIGTGRGTSAEARRIAENDLGKMSRAQLEEEYTRQYGSDGPDLDMFSSKELRDALMPDKLESARDARAEDGVLGEARNGWLGPDGKFHEVGSTDTHEDLARRTLIERDPTLKKEFQKAEKANPNMVPIEGVVGSRVPVVDFMNSKGYVRVAEDSVGSIYIQGKPSALQLRQLRDAAIENGVRLVQDLGARERVLYEPDVAAQQAAPRPTLVHDVGADGKVTHRLEIPEESTNESLTEMTGRIDAARIPDADKARLKAEVNKALQDRIEKPTASGPANARVDAQRVARGLEPRMEPLRRALKQSWADAMKLVEEDPTAGTKLVKDVNSAVTRKNSLTDTETALLAHEQVRRENEFDNAVDAVNKAAEAKDDAGISEGRARLAAARDAVDEVYRAADRTGTLAGQSLAARKILLNSDYTLARMEAMKRAANDGKPLTEEQAAQVKEAFDVLTKLKAQLDRAQEAAQLEAERKIAERAGKTGKDGDEARKAIKKKIPGQLTDEQRLARYKKSLATRQAALEAKIAAGDFTRRKVLKTNLDQEALDAQAAYKRAKEAFDRGVAKDEYANRPLLERALNSYADFVRGIVISSPVAYGKLLAAAATRMILTPAEEAAGAVIRQIPLIKDVAKLAPREGGSSVKAESLAVARGFTLGFKDMLQVLKTGKSDLDVLYGRPDIKPRGIMLEFLGRTHYAMKTVPMRAEFERSMELLTQHAAANGADITDPMVKMQIALDSYKNAGTAIFKANNRVTDAYKAALAGIERKNSRTGKTPLLAKAATTLLKTELPVVGVPTNIVAETGQFVFGSVTGSVKLAQAIYNGIEKLHPDEADQIMRHLKKGSIGAAVMALAFMNPQGVFEAGGFYSHGEKRKRTDLEPESLRVYGVDLDKHWLHNPLYLAMQVSATARRAMDEHLHPHGKEKGVGGAALAALMGLGESVPFAKIFEDTAKLFDDNTRPHMFAEMLKSDTIPQAVQWLAKTQDEDEAGKPIKRKPSFKKGDLEGTIQTMKAGIPGLRQDVPKHK